PGQFNRPAGVAVDGSGNVLVADEFNERIQKFDNGGTFLTTWGDDRQFDVPVGVAADGSGNVFVADSRNDRSQKFDKGGIILTARASLRSRRGGLDGPLAV